MSLRFSLPDFTKDFISNFDTTLHKTISNNQTQKVLLVGISESGKTTWFHRLRQYCQTNSETIHEKTPTVFENKVMQEEEDVNKILKLVYKIQIVKNVGRHLLRLFGNKEQDDALLEAFLETIRQWGKMKYLKKIIMILKWMFWRRWAKLLRMSSNIR